MRLLMAAASMLALVGLAQAGKVEVKGVHLCCGQCVAGVAKALKSVDGVTEAKCDQKNKTVTFTASNDKVAEAGLQALVDHGYFGGATHDGKPLSAKLPEVKSEKADQVVVKDVHVCCKQCQVAINKLFKDAKVTYGTTKPQTEITISGPGLDKANVIKVLQDAGFTGKVN
jgi:copper chaperone CopZ